MESQKQGVTIKNELSKSVLFDSFKTKEDFTINIPACLVVFYEEKSAKASKINALRHLHQFFPVFAELLPTFHKYGQKCRKEILSKSTIFDNAMGCVIGRWMGFCLAL